MNTFPELPQIEPDSGERADAARNRERILCAATRLFADRGAGCVSMDEVAEAAGVGKGTLFRRFGSRASLAAAVLSERERAFQEAIIRGEPPLGPGAPPAERLMAFGEALLETLEAHPELLLAAETGAARFEHPAHAVHRLHATLLLREADPGCDAELLADTLLAALSAELFIHLREVRGMSLERLKQGWRELVRRTVPADAVRA
ncbi:MAG TPA: helix-turn-helix domain-containing protein [Solirubrobacteraceae bacterium]|jgi:AcrR family transcriptional regulator|nr:helix-turn-helix domain-containing protein [Solirubrobacteraceae bacterium]